MTIPDDLRTDILRAARAEAERQGAGPLDDRIIFAALTALVDGCELQHQYEVHQNGMVIYANRSRSEATRVAKLTPFSTLRRHVRLVLPAEKIEVRP